MRRISFKTKLLLQATLATVVALLVSGSALLIFEYVESKSRLVNRLTIQADLIAENLTAALIFDDAEAAGDVLGSIVVDENVICAAVFNNDGDTISSYCSDSERECSPLKLDAIGAHFTSGKLMIVRPIILEAEQIGFIQFEYDLAPIYGNIREDSLAVAMALLVGLMLILLLTWRLQKVVTRPVDELAATAKRISEHKDFSVRAVKYSDDELGDLTDGFNQMLNEIAIRDTALRQSNVELEHRVLERTEQLTQAKRRAEQTATSLYESEARIQAIFDATADSVIVINSRGIVVSCNRTVEEMFGWPVEGLIGKNIAMLTPEPHHSNHDEYIARYLRTDEPRILGNESELIAVRKDGTTFPCSLRITEMIHNQSRSFVGVIQDIHERQVRDERLRRALQEAAGAKEMADTANQAKSEFLANMSHEIRTPMTAILGYVDLLLDSDTSDEDRAKHGNIILRNGHHLLQIINDILDISKIEAGKTVMEKVNTSPIEILADVASLLRPRAEEKGIDFSVRFESPIPEVICSDPTRLRQILLNLVGNAIKFTESGSVVIAMGIEIEKDEASLYFEVIDTGTGMTEEQVKNLFQPFVQADSTVTRKFGGTGLGLTISKRLAEMLGGEISVQSAPYEGSTFSLKLKLGSATGMTMIENPNEVITFTIQNQNDINASSATFDTQLSSGENRGHILLAEDGVDNQRLISTLLEKAGYEVEIAANGQIAFDKAIEALQSEKPFDLIFMDMQMPVMDGYTATRKLRSQGYDRPIIALTAHAMARDRDKCLSAGCNDYAAKPIQREHLLHLVKTNMTGKSASILKKGSSDLE